MKSNRLNKVTQTLGLAIMLVVISFTALKAQKKIWVGSEPVQVSQLEIPKAQNQSIFDNLVDWSNVSSSILPNGDYSSLKFEKVGISQQLRLTDFGFSLPAKSEIKGIELIVYADGQGDGWIQDTEVYLLDDNGIPATINKATKFYPSNGYDGDEELEIKPVVYGFANDTWGKQWTEEEINNPDFGVLMSFRSLTNDTIELIIDHVEVRVHYLPAVKMCDGGCVVFSIDTIREESFEWLIPSGFELVSSSTHDPEISMHPYDADYGVYEICVRVTSPSGIETSCREFIYQNCIPKGRIGGVVFEDENFDGELSNGEEKYKNHAVFLLDENDNLIDIELTDYRGRYQFDDLEAGMYYVSFDPIEEREPTKINSVKTILSNCAKRDRSTDLIDVGEAFEDIGVNAGFVGLGSIGDYVWFDENRNGIQDTEENGFGNVKITLNTIALEKVDSTFSDVNGYYSFTNVYPGEYILVFAEVDSFVYTEANIGSDNSDSDVANSITNGSTDVFFIGHLSQIDSLDAGYILDAATLTGSVVFDNNTNDILDSEDEYIPDFGVRLFDESGSLVSEHFTNEQGQFLIYPVYEGEYYLQFDSIPGFVYSDAFQSVDEDEDFDVTRANGIQTTNSLEIIPVATYTGINAGLQDARGSISGFVWIDNNGNGVFDLNEVRVSGEEVHLYNGSILMESTLTDIDGNYSFTKLLPGNDYHIQFTLPNIDLEPTGAFTSIDQGNNSNITENNGPLTTSDISVNLFDNVQFINGGFTGRGVIETQVFFDENENGILDIDESGVEGIKVVLLDDLDNAVLSLNSDENGIVRFENILAGLYRLTFVTDENFLFTLPNVGADESLDSDVVFPDGDHIGSTDYFELTINKTITEVDAGLINAGGSVEGVVLLDVNRNNSIDNVDEAYSNINIKLFSSNGELIDQMFSNEEGHYRFYPVLKGDYYIVFESIPGFVFSAPNFTGNENDDFSVISNIAVGSTAMFNIQNGTELKNLNAGYQDARGEISGKVWLDRDGSGIIDNGELGLPNIKVTLLLMETQDEIGEVETDENGNYKFGNLLFGSYFMRIDEITNREFTRPNVGANDDIDSEITNAFGLGSTSQIDISEFVEIKDFNMGYTGRGDITTEVFFDENENGVRDMDEEGISGIEVRLLDGVGMELELKLTDTEGAVLFENKLAGEYQLSYKKNATYLFTESNVGMDEGADSDIEEEQGEIGFSEVFTLFIDEAKEDIDAGLIDSGGAIRGQIVFDEDRDNLISNNDMPAVSMHVRLYGSDGELIDNTMTDEMGGYEFSPVYAGSYYLEFDSIPGFMFSTAYAGTDETLDFDITGANGLQTTDIIMISPKEIVNGVNAGYINARGGISGLVWLDNNGNGILDDGEEMVSGVEVYLYDSGGLVLTEVTGLNGEYQFNMILPEHRYYVLFDSPRAGLEATKSNVGADERKDSDITGVNGVLTTEDIDIGYFEHVDYVNGGFTGRGDITTEVFFDENENGVRDMDEEGISGIEVRLLDGVGMELESKLTDTEGAVLFENKLAGEYQLSYIKNATYLFTESNVGMDEGADSDIEEEQGEIGFSEVFMLFIDEAKEDIDAGLIDSGGAIRGQIVFDEDRDNLISSNDMPAVSMHVRLYGSDGELIDNTMTDEMGGYEFSPVYAGSYYLEFDSIPGFMFSTANAGTDETLDFDITGANGLQTTDIITISPKEIVNGVNAGYINARGGISGLVWLDNNGNGILDDGEEMVSGVEVYLYDSGGLVLTEVTGLNGEYQFNMILPEHRYYVLFDSPRAGLEATKSNVGVDERKDSDITGVNGVLTTEDIDIGYFEHVDYVNGGFTGRGDITTEVFFDENENGVRDMDEEGISGIEVRLLDGSGDELELRLTDIEGAVLFENKLAGEYQLSYIKNATYLFTESNVGMDEGVDSDIEEEQGGIGFSEVFMLFIDEAKEDIDAGLILAGGRIGGKVVEDTNRNNVLDEDDVIISNVAVELYSIMGTLVDFRMTDENGEYEFYPVMAGEYYLVFKPISGFIYSSANTSGIDIQDFFVTGSQQLGSTDMFFVQNGTDINYYNAGYQNAKAKISGVVWQDNDGSGTRDGSEPLIDNVNLDIINLSSGNVVKSTVTNSSGEYVFSDIIPGSYFIRISDDLDPLFLTDKNVGSDDTIDSDFSVQSGMLETDELVLANFETITNIDAGFSGYGSIASQVFFDENENGIRDSNENGIENVVVELFNSLDESIDEVTTSNEGDFNFSQVPAGTYYLKFTIGSDYNFTQANVGMDEGIDSDALPMGMSMATTDQFDLLISDNISDVTAGVTLAKGSISGYVVNDLNRNNILDSADERLGGIFVSLFDSSNNLFSSATTMSNGFYQFNAVPVGDYYLVFTEIEGFIYSAPDASTNDAVDFEVTSEFSTGSTGLFNLTDGQSIVGYNAGYIDARGAIQGMVWLDKNNNGLKEINEEFVSSKSVSLYRENGSLLESKMTDFSGNYQFQNLLFDSYYIVFDVLENGQFYSEPFVGTDQTIDSDVTENNGDNSTDLLQISPFSQLAGVNAGVTGNGEIRNSVFIDENGNGIFDSGEDALSNVDVTLLTASGAFVANRTTDAMGVFEFLNVPAGIYTMQFSIPSGYEYTTADQGSDDNVDSDVVEISGNLGNVEEFTVLYNEVNMSVTAGVISLSTSISGKVVIDSNRNDTLDLDEPIADHQIRLVSLNTGAELIGFTDSEGNYSFLGLDAGAYYLIFEEIAGYNYSNADATNDELFDFDVTGNFGAGSTGIVNIQLGQEIKGVNAGYQSTLGSIMGSVWLDLDGDGLYENNESGIDSFKVFLVDTLGTQLDSTLTDSMGMYTFNELDPNHYQILFFNEDVNHIYSPPYRGTDILLDSDVIDSLGNGLTDTLLIEPSINLKGINAGVPGSGVVETMVFIDENENHIFESTESGFPSIPVSLIDTLGMVIKSGITDGNGTIRFEDVFAGVYKLKYEKPISYIFSDANVGIDENIDSDVIDQEGIMGTTDIFSVITDSTFSDYKAGMIFFELMESYLSGNIWDDSNPDGIKKSTEGPIEGIKVTLFDNQAEEVAHTFSDENGDYAFGNLKEGFYYLEVELINGRTVTKSLSDMPTDSTSIFNNENGKGTTPYFYLGVQDTLSNYNAGIANELMLIGIVWDDQNADGIRDDNEPFVPNIFVHAYDKNGVLIDSDKTGFTGNYIFNALTAGEYELVVDLPDGYVCTKYQIGLPDKDNDFLVDGSTGLVDYPASVITAIDAGIVMSGSIGDYIWVDFNGNGVQQSNEPGMNDVKIELFNTSDELIATTFSGDDSDDIPGFYQFTNVQPNDYYIKVELVENYEFTMPGGVLGPDLDSDITGNNGDSTSDTFTLGYDEDIYDIDAGLFIPGSLGDRVWLDEDEDGIQDDNEPGVEDVVVELFRSNGISLGKDTTDVNGNYMFMDLSQGLYFIEVVEYDGYLITAQDQGNDDSKDSDVNSSGVSPLINLAFQVMFMDLDVGLIIDDGNIVESNPEEGRIVSPFTVYPNPVFDRYILRNNIDQDILYNITDQNGTIMESDRIRAKEAQTKMTDHLPAGVYNINAKLNGEMHVERIIIIK